MQSYGNRVSVAQSHLFSDKEPSPLRHDDDNDHDEEGDAHHNNSITMCDLMGLHFYCYLFISCIYISPFTQEPNGGHGVLFSQFSP